MTVGIGFDDGEKIGVRSGEAGEKTEVFLECAGANLNPAGTHWHGGFQGSVYGMLRNSRSSTSSTISCLLTGGKRATIYRIQPSQRLKIRLAREEVFLLGDPLRRMKRLRFRHWPLMALLFCALPFGAAAETVAAHHLQGTTHGYLTLKTEDGILPRGDLVQIVRGDRVIRMWLFISGTDRSMRRRPFFHNAEILSSSAITTSRAIRN